MMWLLSLLRCPALNDQRGCESTKDGQALALHSQAEANGQSIKPA